MQSCTYKDIVRLLKQRADALVRYLLPNGKFTNGCWKVGSIHGEPGDSLSIPLTGSKLGVWCDFASENSKGDLLQLWAEVRKISPSEARLEAMGWLNIAQPRISSLKPTNYEISSKTHPILSYTSAIGRYLIEVRKLTMETLTAFRIEEEGENIIFPYLRDGKRILLKYLSLHRPNGKKQMWTSPNSEPCLFGWQALDPKHRTLVLTEGEIDAMSLYHYKLPHACLSLPFGGGAGKKQQWIEYEFERLLAFDEIYLCIDDDSVGDNAVNEIVQRLGYHRCKKVKLPFKDANECLQNNISREEILKCFADASNYNPQELKSFGYFKEQYNKSKLEPENFYTFPWMKTHKLVQFREAELSVWTGTNGHGKSQLLGQLILSQANQGAKVLIASLELIPKVLINRLILQASGTSNPTKEYANAIFNHYNDKLWIYDLVGTAKTQKLLDVFKYALQKYGINVFVIDSFLKCGIAETDYDKQKLFVEELCDFKNEYKCHIHLVCHPRKGDDEGEMPNKFDIKGTGSVTDLADNCFIVWRNKKKEEELEKNPNDMNLKSIFDAVVRCCKQRNGTWEGKFNLWFDKGSFQFLAAVDQKPCQMVEFSIL